MASPAGIEPAAYSLGGCRSIQLSYENNRQEYYIFLNTIAIKIKPAIFVALGYALGYGKEMSNIHNTIKTSFSTKPLAERQADILAWLGDHKAHELTEIDLSDRNAFADAMIVCSAQSVRQAQALADGLADFCHERNFEFLGMEGYNQGQWILVDLNDIIVNIFQEQSRQLYRLEDLWQHTKDQAETGRALREENLS